MRKITCLISAALVTISIAKTNAQQNIMNYIKVYFSQQVDNTYSTTGVNAVYLNNTIFDTLAAYIDRAKYSVDLAQYEYETWSGDPIATAVNNAYSRGVKVRYLQDGNEAATNSGVKLLNASVPVFSSPVKNGSACNGESYNIMHDKIVIIDEYSPDSTKSFVLTGSADWDKNMSLGDYNNMIIFQSKVLARAYTHEFDIMWGDTTHGAAANSGSAKFGSCKPNSGTHKFIIGGSVVELYFSPTDSTNNHIIDVINSAKVDLYCGMNDFTETTDANDIVTAKNAGVSAYAILDAYTSAGSTPFTTTLPNGLGSNFAAYNNANYLYHNKYIVVNPSGPCDNPVVLTGSHNWTASADAENDENTVIVHNDTIANLYMQAFASDFNVIKGTPIKKLTNPCPNSVNNLNGNISEVDVYPNPFNSSATISYNLSSDEKVTMGVYNIMGQKVCTIVDGVLLEAGLHSYTFNAPAAGVYLVKIQDGNNTYVKKIVSVQ